MNNDVQDRAFRDRELLASECGIDNIEVGKEVKMELLESPWNSIMYPSEVFSDSMDYKPIFYNHFDVNLNELKNDEKDDFDKNPKSFTDYPKIMFQDEVFAKIIKNEKQNDEELFFDIDIKKEIQEYQDTIKTESHDDVSVSDALVGCSMHYDVLVSHEPVQCHLCHTIFRNRFNLFKHNLEHMKVHLKPLDTTSDENKPNKLVALKKELGEKRKKYIKNLYHCVKCNSYMKKDHKKQHKETVHSEMSYECEICGKKFKCLKYLANHKRYVHLKDKPSSKLTGSVVCEQCKKVFIHKCNLYCHIRNVHSDEEWKCNTCDLVFKSKTYLSTHVKRIHQEYGKLFACWCGKEFLSPRRLGYHQRSNHS